MKQKLKNAQRLLVLSLVVEMMRCVADTYFGENNFSSISDIALLCIGIAIGELEGRPMSASKLSDYIGMPRASAMRKLNELQRMGVIDRPTQRSYVLSVAAMQRIEKVNSLPTMLKLIRGVSAELSKLGS